MKRLAHKLAICICLGVLLTIIVSWAIALAVNPLTGTRASAAQPQEGYQWDVGATKGFGSLSLNSRRHETFTGITNTVPEQYIPFWCDFDRPLAGFKPAPGFDEYRTLEARGWPMLALRTHSASLITPEDMKTIEDDAWSLRWPWGAWKLYPFNDQTKKPLTHDILLPLRPIWPGFLVNTLLFATILWLPLLVLDLRRSVWRRRRNLCERCGYPRGASNACTECGRVHRSER